MIYGVHGSFAARRCPRCTGKLEAGTMHVPTTVFIAACIVVNDHPSRTDSTGITKGARS